MNKQRKELQRFLKCIDERSLRNLCQVAMLTETETTILVMSLSREASEYAIADRVNCCVSSIQKRKKKALLKILSFIDSYACKKIRF